MSLPSRAARSLAVIALALGSAAAGYSEEGGWVELSGLDAWKAPEGWSTVGSVTLDPEDPKKLAAGPGVGMIYNGPSGRAKNLVSKESFGDVELHVEFCIPKGSNSGVKFQSVYEIQLFDSHGSTRKPTGRDSGGVYPRSEEKPRHHQIDDGIAPKVNASRPPGEWQVLDAKFTAPKLDGSGNRAAPARITAVLNGQVVQDDLALETPTGSAWHDKALATGPILLQADHGPVAFRNLRARRPPTRR